MTVKFLIFACLLSLVVAQPGVTFDAALHCWVNVTGSSEVTYTPRDIEIINDYVNETVFQVVDELPVSEQGPELLRLEEKIINDLYYTIEVPVTIMDFHRLIEVAPGALFSRYQEALAVVPGLLYDLMVIALETALHTCVDDQPEPDYRFVLRHGMEEITHFIFEAPLMTTEAVEATLNITSAALTAAWEAIDDVGLEFNIVTLELVEGLLLAYEKYATQDFDIRLFATEVVEQSQAIAPEGVELADADVIIKNATEILGIELD